MRARRMPLGNVGCFASASQSPADDLTHIAAMPLRALQAAQVGHLSQGRATCRWGL